MHHELTGRTFENPLQHVAGKLLLGLLGGEAGFIDVRPLRFVSAHGAFCGHNLQELEDRGVAQLFFLAERFMNFANRGGSAVPEHAENFKFGGCGFVRRLLHGRRPYYEDVRSVNENLRTEVKSRFRGCPPSRRPDAGATSRGL